MGVAIGVILILAIAAGIVLDQMRTSLAVHDLAMGIALGLVSGAMWNAASKRRF